MYNQKEFSMLHVTIDRLVVTWIKWNSRSTPLRGYTVQKYVENVVAIRIAPHCAFACLGILTDPPSFRSYPIRSVVATLTFI